MSALVLALAGTDHHPFDRLVNWVDAAAVRLPHVRFVVQHGATKGPLVAQGHDFLPHDQLVDLLGEAAVVVCHGGPGTILEAREAGHLPICVPRDPELGEHVDGHQQRFARLLGGSGGVRLAETAEAFHESIDDALLPTPATGLVDTMTALRDAARQRLAVELDSLMAVRTQRTGRLFRTS